jgi:hypothetical protein
MCILLNPCWYFQIPFITGFGSIHVTYCLAQFTTLHFKYKMSSFNWQVEFNITYLIKSRGLKYRNQRMGIEIIVGLPSHYLAFHSYYRKPFRLPYTPGFTQRRFRKVIIEKHTHWRLLWKIASRNFDLMGRVLCG